jgi:hypothetical protein
MEAIEEASRREYALFYMEGRSHNFGLVILDFGRAIGLYEVRWEFGGDRTLNPHPIILTKDSIPESLDRAPSDTPENHYLT